MRLFVAAIGLGLGIAYSQGNAADWPQFLGPQSRAVAEDDDYPLTWSREENVRWRTALPDPANSSPIVSAGRVFLTTAGDEGRDRVLHCLDRQTGEIVWSQTVRYEKEDPTHKTNPYGAPTPVADGERVVVWHGSAGVYCYDFDGRLLWERDLGEFVHIWGYGSSPVFVDDLVLLNCGPGERTFLVALDKTSGEERWRHDEPGGASGLPVPGEGRSPWIGSWSTPIPRTVDGRRQVLVSFPHRVKAFDVQTGDTIWTLEGLGDLVYTSVVLGDGAAVAMSGYHGPAIGFRLPKEESSATLLWREDARQPQRIGSGAIVGDVLYMANADNGTAQCIEVATGQERWRQRMPKPAACWGSIVRAGDRLYVVNQNGDCVVFRPNPEKLDVLAVNSLGEHSNSTPAFSDGEIFLRTYDAIYCIGR